MAQVAKILCDLWGNLLTLMGVCNARRALLSEILL